MFILIDDQLLRKVSNHPTSYFSVHSPATKIRKNTHLYIFTAYRAIRHEYLNILTILLHLIFGAAHAVQTRLIIYSDDIAPRLIQGLLRLMFFVYSFVSWYSYCFECGIILGINLGLFT